MNLKQLALTGPLATLLIFSPSWAQKTPNSEAPTKTARSTPKEKHLTGSLVDVTCMAKTLASENTAIPDAEPAIIVTHFMESSDGPPHAGQIPGGVGPGTMPGPAQRGIDPRTTPETPIPDVNADDRTEAAKTSKVDEVAKVCAASPTTQTLGLAMPDGQVLQFDQGGSDKAREALKSAAVQPGKKIKAKVNGTMEDDTTVRVASIDIKVKGRRGSSGMTSSGA